MKLEVVQMNSWCTSVLAASARSNQLCATDLHAQEQIAWGQPSRRQVQGKLSAVRESTQRIPFSH